MNVLPDATKILLEHIHLCDLDVLLHAGSFTNFVDPVEVLNLVQIWHVTSVKDVVDVFELEFADDLGVDKQEAC